MVTVWVFFFKSFMAENSLLFKSIVCLTVSLFANTTGKYEISLKR